VQQWGKSGRVHIKDEIDPLSPEVGGEACQQARPEPDEATPLFQQNTGGT